MNSGIANKNNGGGHMTSGALCFRSGLMSGSQTLVKVCVVGSPCTASVPFDHLSSSFLPACWLSRRNKFTKK